MENNDTINDLKILGRKIMDEDLLVNGVKFVIYFKDGRIFEYNSKQDEERLIR